MACLPLDVVLAPARGKVWVGFCPDTGWLLCLVLPILSQLLLRQVSLRNGNGGIGSIHMAGNLQATSGPVYVQNLNPSHILPKEKIIFIVRL